MAGWGSLQVPSLSMLLICIVAVLFVALRFEGISAVRTYDEKRILELREEVRSVFYHGYNNYIQHAYPYDELRPLSCDGVDTWGSYSLTLIDTLDTLAIIGNYSEFRRVAQIIIDNTQFDMNINVSVFETNIRILGGLLSAHLLSQKAGMDIEPGWPCQGPLLRMAEVVARKLLPAFDTPTGMPYGTVNLRYGVPPSETPVTCTAGVGTFIVEFGALSRLTGDPIYEKVALRAIHSLFAKRSALDLVGNHIDTKSGKWTAIDAGIGAGVDSFYEYLVKGSILFQKPELMQMFRVFHKAIEKHLGKGGWYVWATMGQGHVSATTFQSLETFFPGMLSLVGEFKTGLKAMTNYHRILKQYGGLPELYNILQGKATHQREGYPLRPELIESAMYLYRATGDPYMLEIGEDILHSLQYNAKTECGYATIRDVSTLTLEDRMESFFLAETVKYLYLLFDPDNFIHSEGEDVTVIKTPFGKCTLYAGGYIFNTEAHPIDPSALNCCTGVREADLHKEIEIIDESRSPKVAAALKKRVRKAALEEANKLKEEAKKEKKKKKEIAKQEETKEEQGHHVTKLPFQDNIGGLISRSNFGKSYRTNPLLEYKTKFTEIPRVQLKLKNPLLTMLENESGGTAGTGNNENLVFQLLQKLLDEQTDFKDLVGKEFAGGGVQKGLQFQSLDAAKELQSLVESFELKSKAAEELKKPTGISTVKEVEKEEDNNAPTLIRSTGIGRVIKEEKKKRRIPPPNRINSGKKNPDLDALFANTNPRTLSFSFSLKWLPTFPELIRHLIPSEKFDIEKFYSKMSTEFSKESFAKRFNISEDWMTDFDALRCPTIGMADRFMFFRSSIDE